MVWHRINKCILPRPEMKKYCNGQKKLIYRVAAIFPEQFQNFTDALKYCFLKKFFAKPY
jgi:hypothetical protein